MRIIVYLQNDVIFIGLFWFDSISKGILQVKTLSFFNNFLSAANLNLLIRLFFAIYRNMSIYCFVLPLLRILYSLDLENVVLHLLGGKNKGELCTETQSGFNGDVTTYLF